jgi:hypothetical protein
MLSFGKYACIRSARRVGFVSQTVQTDATTPPRSRIHRPVERRARYLERASFCSGGNAQTREPQESADSWLGWTRIAGSHAFEMSKSSSCPRSRRAGIRSGALRFHSNEARFERFVGTAVTPLLVAENSVHVSARLLRNSKALQHI